MRQCLYNIHLRLWHICALRQVCRWVAVPVVILGSGGGGIVVLVVDLFLK